MIKYRIKTIPFYYVYQTLQHQLNCYKNIIKKNLSQKKKRKYTSASKENIHRCQSRRYTLINYLRLFKFMFTIKFVRQYFFFLLFYSVGGFYLFSRLYTFISFFMLTTVFVRAKNHFINQNSLIDLFTEFIQILKKVNILPLTSGSVLKKFN